MSDLFKKNVDLGGLAAEATSALQAASSYLHGTHGATGVGLTKLIEPRPEFARAEAEKVVNKGNSYLVLGRDRPASKLSGYGGRGDTGASSIDLVAGRMGPMAQSVTTTGGRLFCDPNFKIDAARIYISQKTDIDTNFGIIDGEIGPSNAKSGIALKADAIRIIGRESIKLVTRTDMRNSQGAGISSVRGVDIIAGNDDTNLQPMVLGDNTTDCLNEIFDLIDELVGDFQSYITYQLKFNAEIMQHTHMQTEYPGMLTTPSPTLIPAGTTCIAEQTGKTMMALSAVRTNMKMIKFNYLNKASPMYISSKFNNVN